MAATKRLLLLFILLAACSRREGTPSSIRLTSGTPVILISIDTLRADHLPAYGYRGVQTPAIDALRRDGILYQNAWSHVPLTLPSHVSLLTGQLPADTGVRNNIGFPFDPGRHPTAGSLLGKNGYATGAAVSAYVLRGSTGLAGAFDFYDDRIEIRPNEAIGRLQRPGLESEAAAERWISSHDRQPLLFFLHLFEPHTPYDPPEPFRSRYPSLYDGEVAAADAVVGRFLAFLKGRDLYERALIILVSDHGEGLGQHGEDEHGMFLYREDLHVPLIVKLPGSQRANTTVRSPVGLIDVLPTILEVTGVHRNRPGRSLLQSGPPRRIFSESLYARIHLGWSDLRSLADEEFHFIDAPRPELYQAGDPAELRNVITEHRRVYARMVEAMEPFRKEMPSIAALDPEAARKLAALGYLGSAAAETAGPLRDPKDAIGELRLLREAAALEARGDLAGAMRRYERLVAADPGLTDAWSQLGRLQQRTGRTDQAIATYRRAMGLSPSLAAAYALSLGDLYLTIDQPTQAAAHARLGRSANPGAAHIILGRAALAQNDLDGAAGEAQAALKVEGYRIPAQILLAQILVRQGRLGEALSLINEAAAEVKAGHSPPPPLLAFVRGDILARRNELRPAIAALNEEIAAYPQDRQAYASLAVVYLVSGRRREANETMERLIRANPSPSSYELAAATFSQMHQDGDAAIWRRRGRASPLTAGLAGKR